MNDGDAKLYAFRNLNCSTLVRVAEARQHLEARSNSASKPQRLPWTLAQYTDSVLCMQDDAATLSSWRGIRLTDLSVVSELVTVLRRHVMGGDVTDTTWALQLERVHILAERMAGRQGTLPFLKDLELGMWYTVATRTALMAVFILPVMIMATYDAAARERVQRLVDSPDMEMVLNLIVIDTVSPDAATAVRLRSMTDVNVTRVMSDVLRDVKSLMGASSSSASSKKEEDATGGWSISGALQSMYNAANAGAVARNVRDVGVRWLQRSVDVLYNGVTICIRALQAAMPMSQRAMDAVRATMVHWTAYMGAMASLWQDRFVHDDAQSAVGAAIAVVSDAGMEAALQDVDSIKTRQALHALALHFGTAKSPPAS